MCWGHSPLGFSGSEAQIPLQLSLSLTIQIMNFDFSIFKFESIKKIICQPQIFHHIYSYILHQGKEKNNNG